MRRETMAPWMLWAALLAAPAWGQQTLGDFTDDTRIPEGVVGERIRELLDVIDSGDPRRVEKLVQDHFGGPFRDELDVEDHQRVFAEVKQQAGKLSFYAVRKYTTPRDLGEVVIVVRTGEEGGWMGIMMRLEPEPPNRILGLNFSPARPPKELAPKGRLSRAAMLEELRAYVAKRAEQGQFSGTVLLARDGRVMFSAAYGEADKSFQVPNKLDTKFNLGSMNKMFTAVAVAQLAERGKLSFDDPISKHLSRGWLSPSDAERIQIRHLLTHTSGLGSYFNEKFMRSSRDLFREIDDYRPLVTGEKAEFKPGTKWSYSNTGFLLLGAIVEEASGQNYFDYVREHIYKPAGMKNTDCYDVDEPIPNLAIGYSRNGKTWKTNTFQHVIRGGPAGGGYSTVEDLLRFDQALRNHKLLSEKTTELLLSAKPDLSSPNYGFGFGVKGNGDDWYVGHSGGFPGINSELLMGLDSGYTIAVMSNYDGGAEPLVRKIRELLARMDG